MSKPVTLEKWIKQQIKYYRSCEVMYKKGKDYIKAHDCKITQLVLVNILSAINSDEVKR